MEKTMKICFSKDVSDGSVAEKIREVLERDEVEILSIEVS